MSESTTLFIILADINLIEIILTIRILESFTTKDQTSKCYNSMKPTKYVFINVASKYEIKKLRHHNNIAFFSFLYL